MAREDRLDELRDYADERELDEVLLLIPYCNLVFQGVEYLYEPTDIAFKGSVDIGKVIFKTILLSIGFSESPIYEFQRQAKEYNIDHTFSDATKESEEYQKLYPVLSRFCTQHDPFKDFNKIFLKLKDDDRAISWCYSPKELEIRLGDIKQQLSLKNEFSYVGMMDYKAILPLAELEKYREMKGYMGKKIKITGVNYIVWVTEREFKKIGEICSRFDNKLEIFKQECTKLVNQFIAECTEQKSIAEEFNKVKKQREELEQENKQQNENYKKKKRSFVKNRMLMLLFSIISGFAISRIMLMRSVVWYLWANYRFYNNYDVRIYGVISGLIIMILGFIFIRKPKEPKVLEETDMPPLPEEPVNKEVIDIFIDVLSREIIKAENQKRIGTVELRDDKKT
jgi:hypothetical protein